MSFIIYDVETSGTDTTFDQVFQFAAIRSDNELRELDNFSLRCRRLPHVIPSPAALLVTGLRPRDLEEAPLSHYEMACAVEKRFAKWSRDGAVFLGYNSIRFDEVLLRQTYYQNLLPIYQTNTSGNVRADVMRIVQACAVYHPGAIAIPIDAKGRGQFKLTEIAGANGVELEHAHEALADATATLAVARLVRDRAADIWTTMLDNARKAHVDEAFRSAPFICLSDFFFGAPYNFVVTEAGRNANDASEIAVFDLAHDPEPYLELPEAELMEWITGKVKVIRRTRSNSQPMLFPFSMMPKDIRGGRHSPEEYERRAKLIWEHEAFQKRVGRVLSKLYEDEPPSPYVEGRMYDGFPTDGDKALMQLFHASEWPSRWSICQKIQDERFRELAMRVIHVERPELLPQEVRARHHDFVANRILTDKAVPWLTVPKALQELADLKRTANRSEVEQLNELKEYLVAMAQKHARA